jgi:GTP pyrophosphokinase
MSEAQLERLLEIAKLKNPQPESLGLIRRAFNKALQAHANQKRNSGDPYFNHVYQTALTVARWGLDEVTIAAALLHDTLEDTNTKESELKKEFGEEVVFLVNGVTKISHIKYRGNQAQAETLKKMILAMSEDVRVVFVKLADRTHNMQTLQFVPKEKQQRIALETSEIYAPLAYRMGLGSVSGDLEDLAFPYLDPEAFNWLTNQLKDHLESGEKYIQNAKEILTQELNHHPELSIVLIESRSKRLSSLNKKLKRYDSDLNKVYDLIAIRIITKELNDCYAILGYIHKLWPPLPGHVKDYIALPKPNGYRSLHTTVITEAGRPIEFQIRTEAMHRENEYGIAAYWAYQEGKNSNEYREKKAIFAKARQTAWINQLKQWQANMDDPDEFIASLKIDFFKDRIFVITPKGEAIDLPANSTPVDFAYAIHTDIGDHCVGAKVNSRMVTLSYELQSGDVVEILVNKNRRPNPDWLLFVKTKHARDHIRAAEENEIHLPVKGG